jgi:transposase
MRLLTDEQWARLAPCLPRSAGKAGRPFADHRRIIEGIIYRYRTGIPWRDLPREAFGPWQTVWKRHRRWAADGTWDTVLARLTAPADSNRDRLEGLGRLDNQPGPPARHEHGSAGDGHRRRHPPQQERNSCHRGRASRPRHRPIP